MKEGIYYSCVNEFLNINRNSSMKKFLLIAEYTNFQFEDLEEYKGEIIGAIVPFIIYNTEIYNKGVISCDLNDNNNFLLIEDLKDFSIENSFFSNNKSIMVFIDGLSSYISDFLDTLFENIPENTQVIGGGAGKMTFERDPVIFTKHQFCKDAAIIISLDTNLNLGIENGWEYLEGPFLTTNSHNNLLKTLNFRNAFEVYKEVVEKDSGMKFADDNFFDIAKSYPIGIIKYDKEIVVRDPILVDEDNNLVLVGDIPKNSTINILKGNKETLIISSEKAMKKALEKIDESADYNVVLFDCISRSIFLKDDFVTELEQIKKHMNPSKNLFGALTLGEIANNGNEYIIFYNRTCVIGVLC
jgi:hypothetical protein